uniref:LIM domain only protein 7-like n=1 Tax=Sinocyclocheilus rhinocerous TaxID=307959 RepID=A0A673I6X6_9TELE
KKKFVSSNFRSSLENGLLLCDLINKIRPGVVKKLNRLSTPIAGLDNISLFLKACAKLGLKEAQLFHPGDLQDLSTRVTVKHQESSRRLKNVLITIYWLGRKAHADHFYNGPYLKLKAFEGLLGKALYKTLEDCTSLQGSVRNSSCRDSWYSEKEELFPLRAGHRREDSLDSLDSLGSRTYSTSSDATLKGSSEGCGSDPEADLSFMMSENKEYRRSLVVAPKTTTQYNQFLPSKDKQSGYVPAPLRKKRAERNDDNRRSWASPMYTEDDGTFTRSKSVSDITDSEMNLSNLSMELRVEEMQKMRARLKDNEDKWQDDLSRWKNKRRSVNSDIVKKKEEREQIDQISSGGIRKSKTFKEMQDERESRQQSNYRDSFNSISDDVFEEPVPRSRTLPARSYTIDTPYAPKDKPSVPSIPYLREKEPVAGTLASDQTDFHTRRDRFIKNSSGPISSLYKPNSMDTKQSGLDQVSASLPRSYQRSDSARLTSVVTPRPFGTQSNRITSLPRVDNSLKRTNGETDSLKKSTISNRYAQYVKEDDDISQESPVQSSDEEEEEEKTPSPVPPVNRLSPLPKSPSTLIPSNEVLQDSQLTNLTYTLVDYSEMRISLNQKPNSSRDFGFQSDWDSTGVRVKSVVPEGSPAELGQVKVGDEILTVNGHMVADLSYTEWKNSMEEALQQGSLFMDICRHGKNSKSTPSFECSTLRLHLNSTSNIFISHVESITLKNLKRRSEFFEQGNRTASLPVPSITTSTTRSWDPEEERKRQEKWQKEQERLLQEKYRKDQEKLEEEWRKAQHELEKENFKKHEEVYLIFYLFIITVASQYFTDASKKKREEEQRKRREEEWMRLEEERRKREEQERLEEEKKKKREEEERKKREQDRLRLEEERRKREEQEYLEELRRNREEEERLLQEKERNRREEERSSGLGEFSRDYKKEPQSQAEVERQQILHEMKKKTSLNTDNSWIRQQSAANVTTKELMDLPIRRGESLDNLDMPRSSWRSSWSTSNSTVSIPDYSRPHSSLSGSSSYQSGRPESANLQSSQSMSSLRQSWFPSAATPEPEPRAPPRNRSVSGRKICSFCNTPLGKGAAMIIESQGLCYHLSCFKCFKCRSDLGGSEAGAEVRIRNQQLYCNSCYMRLKSGQPTAM